MPDISQETADLLFLGLDHGIASVSDGGPLTPFVIAERAGARHLTRFAAETLEESVDRAVAAIIETPIDAGDRSVLVYDGYLTAPGSERLDAIYAEAIESDGTVIILAQRYRPESGSAAFETVGNAALLQGAVGRLSSAR
jgi:hypothetical protein